MTKQFICDCGRIAEVRHRSNGQKLAYPFCQHCRGGIVSAVKAAELEAKAQDNIGVFGEFANTQGEQEKTETSAKTNSADWQPAPNETPEVLESDLEISKTENDEKPRRGSNGFKWLLGLLITGTIGGAAYVATRD